MASCVSKDRKISDIYIYNFELYIEFSYATAGELCILAIVPVVIMVEELPGLLCFPGKIREFLYTNTAFVRLKDRLVLVVRACFVFLALLTLV